MDTRRLRYFVQIVDSGSITRAAAASGVAQPALSQQLAILENDLKVKLLDRSVSGVKPTAAGRILYARAQAILRQFDDLREAVHREVRPLSGTVVVGMPPSMLTRFGFPLIGQVCTQHPEMHLQIREEGSLVLDELLMNGKIEISISATRPEGAVVGEEILTEAVVVEIDSLHSAMETVRRGFGVGATTLGAIQDDLEAGTLKARALGDAPLMRSMYLARRQTPALTPAAEFVHGLMRDIAADPDLARIRHAS